MSLKHILIILSCIAIFSSCSEDDKAIEIVTEEIERGAVLRNIERFNSDFDINDLQSTFKIELEEQDLEEGALLDFVRLYIDFRDFAPGGALNKSEVILRDIDASAFSDGPNQLPRITLEVTFEEVLSTLSISQADVQPGDQFGLRAEIHLRDGRTFSVVNGSPSIIIDSCFFKSPYRYEISVIEPLAPDAFTGTYRYEIVDADNDFGIGGSGVIQITNGHSINTRKTPLFQDGLEFTIAGNNVFPKIYQAYTGFCREGESYVLTGPQDDSFGIADPSDDSVFFLDFVVGFEGWDGFGEIGPQDVRIRFTKQ